MIGLGLDLPLAAPALTQGHAAVPPAFTEAPAVTGSGAVGTLLSASPGAWRAGPRAAVAWAWQRDGADIPGAAGSGSAVSPHAIQPGDFPGALRLRVTVTDDAGTAEAVSDAVAAIFPAPSALPGAWTLPLRQGEAMGAFDAARAFTGLSLAFGLAPGSPALPAGLALSAAGLLSGTPAAAGTLALTLRATNPGGHADRGLTLAVAGPLVEADYAAGSYWRQGTGALGFGALHDFARAGEALRLGPSGSYETVAAGAPRLDHDAAGAPLGLLVEPAAENRVLHAESFTTGWTASGVTATPAGLARRGRWGGMTLASGGGLPNRLHRGLAVTAGEVLPLTLWYLPGTSGRLRILLRDEAGAADTLVRGPAGALAVTATAAGAVDGLAEATEADGIRRVSLRFAPAFTGELRLGFGPDSAVAGESVTLLMAQTALGSPVPAAAAPGLRAAESVTLLGLAPGFLDVVATDGTGAVRLLAGVPVSGPVWPAPGLSPVRRLRGFPRGHDLLTLADGGPLALESGRALYLETAA